SGGPTMFSVKSVNNDGSLTTLLFTSTICVSLVIGSGGENCQWMVNRPGAIAHSGIVAMRKSGPHPAPQEFKAPSAMAPQPTGVLMLRNTQGSGPLHHSFCSTVSNGSQGLAPPGLVRDCTAWVSTHEASRGPASAMSARLAS